MIASRMNISRQNWIKSSAPHNIFKNVMQPAAFLRKHNIFIKKSMAKAIYPMTGGVLLGQLHRLMTLVLLVFVMIFMVLMAVCFRHLLIKKLLNGYMLISYVDPFGLILSRRWKWVAFLIAKVDFIFKRGCKDMKSKYH